MWRRIEVAVTEAPPWHSSLRMLDVLPAPTFCVRRLNLEPPPLPLVAVADVDIGEVTSGVPTYAGTVAGEPALLLPVSITTACPPPTNRCAPPAC